MKEKIHNALRTSKKGQSLVEIAITAPLLIFLMIGVFEVGWALRGYLVLVNVNREITRYSVRPGYLDFSTKDSIRESYASVRDWAGVALSNQLKLDFNNTGNATIIVSHVVVNTGKPCKDINDNACKKCSDFDDPDHNPFPLDDLIIHPEMNGQEFQQERFGPATGVGGPRVSRVKFTELVSQTLIPQNNRFNCEIIKKGGIPSDNNAVVTEVFYDQPQLFGFPLVSNPLTDPVPLYSHTMMRLVSAARGDLTANIDNIGPVCMAYPFTVRDTRVPTTIGGTFDMLDGASNYGLSPSANDRGFLDWWPPSDTSTQLLQNEISYPQLSITQYANAANLSDTNLSVGDYVHSLPGNNGGVNDTNFPLLDNIVGKEIIIPVWDSYNTTVSAYHITRFIRVRITAPAPTGISLTSNDPFITGTYLGLAEECNEVED